MSKYLDRAKELRAIVTPHYNCGQSVVLPFAKDAGLTEEQAMGICANFGGGLKRAAASFCPSSRISSAFVLAIAASITSSPVTA